MKRLSISHIFRPLCVLMLLPVSGYAQEDLPPPLTLAIALERAATSNPALVAQRYNERASEALIEQAGYRPNPELEVTAEDFSGTGRLGGADGIEATLQASQTIERGGKREKRIALARRERDSTAIEFAVRHLEVLATTTVAYIEMLAALERHALALESLKLGRETVAAVEAHVNAAIAPPAESARARAALAAAGVEFARAESEMAAARAALVATWGGSPAELPTLSGTLHVPAALPAEDAFLSKLSNHPRLALQQSIVAGRRASLELEQARTVQDVTVGGGVRFLREGSDAAFVAGVSVPLPIRNKNHGNIRAARETLAGAEHGIRAVEVELRAAFSAAWQELRAAHTATHTLSRDALPETEEAYNAVRHAYEQGQLPLIDVLDAQRALVALRRELLAAQTDYAVALARVEALTDPAYPAVSTLLNHR